LIFGVFCSSHNAVFSNQSVPKAASRVELIPTMGAKRKDGDP
jgi:hypothetical protein